MIKIEKVTDKKGITRTLDEVAELYWLELQKDNYNGNANSYRKNLKSRIAKFCNNYSKRYSALCTNLKDDAFLKKLICGFPDIKEWQSFSLDLSEALGDKTRKSAKKGAKTKIITLKDELETIFNYETLQKYKITHWLGEKLNIAVCPYCNVQPLHLLEIVNTKGKKETVQRFQFEHFYPQKHFPFFAISFYNLVPSCANCNLRKSEKNTSTYSLIYPYQDSFHEKCAFSLDIKNVIDFVSHRKSIKPKFDLLVKNSVFSETIENHNETFNFSDIHQEYKDVIEEIYWKKYVYNDSRIKELESIKGLDLQPEEINRFILGNYTEEKDFLKRPLSKLTHDIAQELGLIP
jgi:hypothetical protein